MTKLKSDREGDAVLLEEVESSGTSLAVEVMSKEKARERGARFIIVSGRGNTGKSEISRWMAERALVAGRDCVIADADLTNRTLSRYFGEGLVVSPDGDGERIDDRVMRRFVDNLVDRSAEGTSVVLDMGAAGVPFLKLYGAEVRLVQALEGIGIVPVAVHMAGSSVDDLAYVQALEPYKDQGQMMEGLFAPERTALVFNEGVIQLGLNAASAFRPLYEHPIAQAAKRRGATVLVMPQLVCMRAVDQAGARFRQAAEEWRRFGIGVMDGSRVDRWWDDMEVAFEPVADWLP